MQLKFTFLVMETTREIYASFSVTSGCLCYSAFHNIWQGSSVAPIQEFPSAKPKYGGTVRAHQLEFNIPAQNGTWNAFHLVEASTNQPSGWFISHSDVSPDLEIDKILRVSGSPYEPESGSHRNNDKTRAEGVFVIGRYDWGYYDQLFEEICDGVDEGEDDMLANSNSAGLVDYEHAKEQGEEWKQHCPSEREPSDAGVWMYSPHGEYMFGRFGFDDDHTVARSFLFFSTDTYFTRTAFAGTQQFLRKEETSLKRFNRQLQEGYDFSGIELLRNPRKPPDDPTILPLRPALPPESQILGPYDRSEHIFRDQDIEALQADRQKTWISLVLGRKLRTISLMSSP